MSRQRWIQILTVLPNNPRSSAQQVAELVGISRTNAGSNLAKPAQAGLVHSPGKVKEAGPIRAVNVKSWVITDKGREWVANPPAVKKPIRTNYPKVLSVEERSEMHANWRGFLTGALVGNAG